MYTDIGLHHRVSSCWDHFSDLQRLVQSHPRAAFGQRLATFFGFLFSLFRDQKESDLQVAQQFNATAIPIWLILERWSHIATSAKTSAEGRGFNSPNVPPEHRTSKKIPSHSQVQTRKDMSRSEVQHPNTNSQHGDSDLILAIRKPSARCRPTYLLLHAACCVLLILPIL